MLGGIMNGARDLMSEGDYGAFEQTLERVLGDRLRASEDDANAMWGALANVDWFGPKDEEVGYSFRAAGDLLAAIRKDEGDMCYMRYYCAVPDGIVPEWVEDALGAEGWRWEATDRT